MRSVVLVAVLGLGCGRSTTATAPPTRAERDQQAVLRVLRADQRLAQTRDRLPPGASPAQVAAALGRYCDELERLPMADCPADFRVAYRHHMGAWREARAAVQKLPDGFFEGVIAGAVNAILKGERDGGSGRLEGDVKRGLERVRDTWIEVEKVGARYGAAL